MARTAFILSVILFLCLNALKARTSTLLEGPAPGERELESAPGTGEAEFAPAADTVELGDEVTRTTQKLRNASLAMRVALARHRGDAAAALNDVRASGKFGDFKLAVIAWTAGLNFASDSPAPISFTSTYASFTSMVVAQPISEGSLSPADHDVVQQAANNCGHGFIATFVNCLKTGLKGHLRYRVLLGVQFDQGHSPSAAGTDSFARINLPGVDRAISIFLLPS